MPKKKYIVELSKEEIDQLEAITSKGTSTAKAIRRSKILLETNDIRNPKLTVREVADRNQVSTNMVNKVRKSYTEQGVEQTITRKKRETPPVPPKITGEIEAKIIALSCMEPPEGYCRWTIRLLTKKIVELGYIETIGRTTVNTILKKTNCSRT